MDHSHHRKVSLLEGEEFFFNKVLSRDSSVGCSSRIFYNRSAEGVPFKWEIKPGAPKDQPKEDIIPPLSPPPAVLGLGLPKPCINIEDPKASMRSKFMFWKINKKNQGIKHFHTGFKESDVNDLGSEKFVSFEFYSSDGEQFMASPRNSSSSSSSSFSLSNALSVQSSRMQSPARENINGFYGCSPWNITSTLARVGRRS